MNSFQNKTVLISGAGKGIGRAITLAFAKEGANIAIFDKNPDFIKAIKKELDSLEVKSVTQVFDISNQMAIESFLKVVQIDLGKIDTLVNNAGFGMVKKFTQTTESDFDEVISTNFKGAFFLTQQTLPLINKDGNIIFITSIHAEHPSLDPVYDASKSAINNLVLNLSLGLAKDNIRVNAIAPGHIDVSIRRGKPRRQEDVPLTKKAGFPDDIAEACLFLADNLRARYITGVILPVTGGLHIPIARDIKF